MDAILPARDAAKFRRIGGRKGEKKSPGKMRISRKARETFARLGRIGGRKLARKYGHAFYAANGRLGGKPRKYRPCEKATPKRRGRHSFNSKGLCGFCGKSKEQVKLPSA